MPHDRLVSREEIVSLWLEYCNAAGNELPEYEKTGDWDAWDTIYAPLKNRAEGMTPDSVRQEMQEYRGMVLSQGWWEAMALAHDITLPYDRTQYRRTPGGCPDWNSKTITLIGY